jgi:hypothetical protein
MDALYTDLYKEVLELVEKDNISLLKAEEDIVYWFKVNENFVSLN